MEQRKITYRMYPDAAQAERMGEVLGLHQRPYNTALEERVRVYEMILEYAKVANGGTSDVVTTSREVTHNVQGEPPRAALSREVGSTAELGLDGPEGERT